MEALTVQTGELSRISDNLNELVERFLLSQDIKETSRRTYERSLRRFIEWITEREIVTPTREDILAYKAHLKTQGLSPFTLSCYMVSVRKLFEYLEAVKLYPNVARGIKGAKKARGFRKDPLTVDQVKTLLNSINRRSLQGKRDYALLNLLVRTGLRTIEVVRADIEDIRQESGEALLWIQGKGRDAKDEFVLLTQETLKPIQTYLRTRGKVRDGDSLFISLSDRNQGERLTTRSVSRIVKEHFREIGMDSGRLTAHSLRHTAITLSLLGGATIQEAKEFGRHSDINTTMIYAHNINRVEHAPERKIDALLAS